MNKPIIFRICLALLLNIGVVLPVCAGNSPVNKYLPDTNFTTPGSLLPPSLTNITICNNQLPYRWNNITCLTAGTYQAILTAADGGDSVAVLNLSVINISTSITNVIICDNVLPYQWNGNTYANSGTYSVTLSNAGGCDSVAILSLTVNHFVTSTTSTTVCSNLLPYNWNGNSYTAAGNYSATLTSAAGCDSIASLTLTVKPVAASTTSTTVCSNQLPYVWNGRSYAAAGIYAITLLAANGCDSVASLNLQVKPVASSISRATICSNQLPYSWNGQAYNAAGTYPVTLVSHLNCDSIANLVLTVLPVSSSTSSITICTGQLPYNWNGNTYATAGLYNVMLTGSNGCDSIANLQLSASTFLTSTTEITICNSQLPYNWNGNNYTTTGNYTIPFVTAAGCDSFATLDFRVATPHNKTDSFFLCSTQLPYNYRGHIFAAAGDYEINPPYVVSACVSVDSVHIEAIEIPPGSTIARICNNQLPYIWNGQPYTSSGNYSTTLTSASGCDSLVNLDLTINPLSTLDTNITICAAAAPYSWNGNLYSSSGTYTARLTSSGGCDSVVTIHLTITPVKTSITAMEICNAQVPYSWNGNAYTSSGSYDAMLIGSDGCDSVATLHLFVQNFLTSVTNITVCNNQLPYSWNGNVYSTAGTYTANLISSAGCDSVATLNLAINNVIRSTTNITACREQMPYNWNGNSYSIAGIYAATLITAAGCDSVATLNLRVSAPDTSINEITICNNQLPYTWNGNVFPIAGIYPVTIVNSAGCDSVAILNLVVKAILTSTTNVNICTIALPYVWNGNSYATGGTYSVTLTTAAGCDSVPILSLTVVPFVTSTTDLLICSNQLPFVWNDSTYTGAGTYSVLFNRANNCDSLATLNLSVRQPIVSTTNISICPLQLPFTWNGRSYTTGGTYTSTITNSIGCDSVATLNLTVLPVAASNTIVTLCDNQLPYQWNGNTYTAAGRYNVTFTGSNGCDSVAALNLIVNPTTASSTAITICTTQLPYNWNGNSYSSAGIYTAALTGRLGCDSVATLKLFVNPVVRSNTIVHTCTNRLPYIWNGRSYTAAGIYNDTLISNAGCDSIASLRLIVDTIGTSNTNITLCNTALPYNWNGNNYSSSGIYTAMLTASTGCDSIATLQLLVNAATTSTTTVNTCTNHLPYVWNGQQYTATGTYFATLTNATGCDSVASLQLVVHPVTASNTSMSICSAQLPYVWNGQSFTTAGLHTVTLSTSAGCDSVATLDLTINLTPLAPATLPVTYCQYDNTLPLTATITTAGSQLLWYTAASGGTSSTTPPLPSSAVAENTDFYVSQLSGNCEGPRVIITVTINQKPVLGPVKNIKVCYGDSLNLTSLFNTVAYQSAWTLNGQPVPFPDSVRVAGSYQLLVTTNSGCLDTSFVNLTILPEVFANAGPDDNAEYNGPYQLSGNGNGVFEWKPPAPLNNPYIDNPVAVLTHDEVFVLKVTNELGCTASDTVKLRVLNGPGFYIPNAFSPDGDGLNDVFRPTAVGIKNLEYFRIFNRYGEKVFETNIIGKGWDGIYKGVKQNIGNYVWMLKGTNRLGELKTLKGNVVLVR